MIVEKTIKSESFNNALLLAATARLLIIITYVTSPHTVTEHQ